MFEEDFERCFICQQPCKGLYCSSQCRTQDKGTPSPAIRASPTPVKLTTPLPHVLSPLVHPVPHNGPSPMFHSSSSTSSTSSSPLHSPGTLPSGSDSPPHLRKESFNLPPPAYSIPQSLGISGSIPVKIPVLISRPSPAPSQSPAPGASSVETLHFGRKSGAVNSVTSPSALRPRCACGRPAGHRQSNETPGSLLNGDIDANFANLYLGPSLNDSRPGTSNRVASDSAIVPNAKQIKAQRRFEQDAVMNGMGAASLLSRSRSDPIPPSPNGKYALKAGQVAPLSSNRDNAHRRASDFENGSPFRAFESNYNAPGGGAPSSLAKGPSAIAPPSLHRPALAHKLSEVRGRSRERQRQVDSPKGESPSLLNQPPDREYPPSRSEPRTRSDEERERRRERERNLERSAFSPPEPQPQITPSWSKRDDQSVVPGGGLTPKRLANGVERLASGQRSPVSPVSVREGNGGGSDEDRRKAEEKSTQAFGHA